MLCLNLGDKLYADEIIFYSESLNIKRNLKNDCKEKKFLIWSDFLIISHFYSFSLYLVYSNSQMAVSSRGRVLIYINTVLKTDQGDRAVWTIPEKQNNIAKHWTQLRFAKEENDT